MASPIEHKQAQIDENGQLTIPDEYRAELGLVPGTAVTFVRVSTSLLVLPENTEFDSVADRLTDFFQSAGVGREDVLAELARIRQEEFTRRFPDLASSGE